MPLCHFTTLMGEIIGMNQITTILVALGKGDGVLNQSSNDGNGREWRDSRELESVSVRVW